MTHDTADGGQLCTLWRPNREGGGGACPILSQSIHFSQPPLTFYHEQRMQLMPVTVVIPVLYIIQKCVIYIMKLKKTEFAPVTKYRTRPYYMLRESWPLRHIAAELSGFNRSAFTAQVKKMTTRDVRFFMSTALLFPVRLLCHFHSFLLLRKC